MNQKMHTIPDNKVSMGIVSNDMDGKEGGTNHWCTITFQFKIADKREAVIAKVMEAFDIAQKNLIKS